MANWWAGLERSQQWAISGIGAFLAITLLLAVSGVWDDDTDPDVAAANTAPSATSTTVTTVAATSSTAAPETTTASTTSPPSASPATTTTAPGADCLPGADERAQIILDTGWTGAGDVELEAAALVEVEIDGATDRLFLLAADISAPSMAERFYWWTNETGGLIIGADTLTREFVAYGSAASADSDAALSARAVLDAGQDDVDGCLNR
ncbi:MAG: hypothetical protein AAFZ07_19505 [Actinomycetota bacterium]